MSLFVELTNFPGINTVPWRSIFISILNMPSALKKRTSVPAYTSKINRRSLRQKEIQCLQDLTTNNASIYLPTESSEREKRRDKNEKKIREFKNVSLFTLRMRSASAIDAETSMRHYVIFWTHSLMSN